MLPQRVDRTPRAMDCLVVVAGVRVGGKVAAVESTMPAAWWRGWRGGADICVLPRWSRPGVSSGLLAGCESAAELGIVGIALLELQVNAWPLCTVVKVLWTWDAVIEGMRWPGAQICLARCFVLPQARSASEIYRAVSS